VLVTLNNLAFIEHGLGDQDEAIKHYNEALSGRTEVLGAEHPRTITSAINLALTLAEAHRATDAESVLRASIQTLERTLGNENRLALLQKANYARVLVDIGRVEEGEELLRDSAKMLEAGLGGAHPDAVSVRRMLVIHLMSLEEFEESEAILRDLHRVQSEVYGVADPRTLDEQLRLATFLQERQAHEEAEDLYRQAVGVGEATLGKNHLTTLNALLGLAALLDETGAHSPAESILADVLKRTETAYGRGSDEYQNVLHRLAFFYLENDRSADAEPLFHELAEFADQRGDQRSAIWLWRLECSALSDQGSLEKAVALCRKAVNEAVAVVGAYDPLALGAKSDLASLLIDAESYDDARDLCEQVLDAYNGEADIDPRKRAGFQVMLGIALVETGQAQAAVSHLEQAIEMREQELGDGHWLTWNARSWLGRCRSLLGKFDEAEALLIPSYEHLKEEKGAMDIRTQRARRSIIALYELWGREEQARPFLQPADRSTSPPNSGSRGGAP
jgi:tetratricopeptide (TPR) repeat protein